MTRSSAASSSPTRSRRSRRISRRSRRIPKIASIAVTKGGIVATAVATFEAYRTALDKIVGGFHVADSAANVQAKLDTLVGDAAVSRVTISDNGTIDITAALATSEASVIDKLHNADGAAFHLAVSGSGTSVAANLPSLETLHSHIVAISITTGNVSVGATTFAADRQALDKITGGFRIIDSAANVKTHLAGLASDVANITRINLEGAGTQALSVTAAQDAADAALIAKIVAPFVLDVAVKAGVTTTTGHGNHLTIADVAGTDTITGGGTNETFIFKSGFGHAAITDAHSHWTGSSHDVIDFAKGEFANFAALLSHATFSASGATITKGADHLTIDGFASKSAFTAGDTAGDFKFLA